MIIRAQHCAFPVPCPTGVCSMSVVCFPCLSSVTHCFLYLCLTGVITPLPVAYWGHHPFEFSWRFSKLNLAVLQCCRPGCCCGFQCGRAGAAGSCSSGRPVAGSGPGSGPRGRQGRPGTGRKRGGLRSCTFMHGRGWYLKPYMEALHGNKH